MAKDLLSLAATGLLSLTLTTVILSEADHSGDVALLLKTDELFGKRVHSFADDGSLEGLSDSVSDALLIGLQELLLLREVGLCFPLFSGAELSDQIKTLLLALEHHVLDSTASNEPLQEHDGTVAFVSLKELGLFSALTRQVIGGIWTRRKLLVGFLVSTCRTFLGVTGLVDKLLSFVECGQMLTFLAS